MLAEKKLIRLTGELALHPSFKGAAELFEDSRLAIVQGVGYPNPNRSHFESMSIWHTASLDAEQRRLGNGWLGDAISTGDLKAGPHAIHVGHDDLPVALHGRRCTAATVSGTADLELAIADLYSTEAIQKTSAEILSVADFVTGSVANAYASAKELAEATNSDASADYPQNRLGRNLQMVSQMIKSEAAARVYYTTQTGYDTHASQLPTHSRLLSDLSRSLKSFMDDMHSSGLEDRVLVMAFSEFGRRVSENGSLGTDHGTAGSVFLAGTRLSERVYGKTPSLLDLDNGDLKYSTDFRDVYAAVLRDWLNLDRPPSLRGHGQDLSLRS